MQQTSISVLLIEDDSSDAYLLQEVLAGVPGASFDFTWVGRLAAGLKSMAETDFDVVLLDLSLPDSHGLETFYQVQAQTPKVPVVVLTGFDDAAVAIQAMQAGAQDFLNKGALDGNMLTRAIRYAIERHRLQEQVACQTQELLRANEALRRSNQELDQFTHIVSHDLQEPLRGLHSYATFLLEDYADTLDEAGCTKLQTLTRLTTRMQAMIASLLAYSRVDRIDLAYAETDLGGLLTEVLDSLAIRLRETGVEVRVTTPLPTLRCDAVRVREVFRNLITNAMKYNDKPQKWVEIGAVGRARRLSEPPGPAGLEPGTTAPWVFFVRDNGIGILPKHYDTIFHIFKRLHGRDAYGGGTGAGLTIVKKIIERHNGGIWVESTYGTGSTFYFTLEGKEQGCER
jgi:light-regulated signal transduction histidine kinase (bacteriophytochrome)